MFHTVLQAYYGLVLKAELKKFMSVLIIGGYTSVGRAAIAVALSIGSPVYVVYAKKEQQHHLIEQFPQVNGEF